jgi:hypothetical protein
MPKSKKSKAEIVVFAPASRPSPIDNAETMLNELIQRKVAEALAANESVMLQPFFQTKAVATSLRKLQNVHELRKWSFYFDDHGCLICGTKDVPHASLGMCTSCLRRTSNRLIASVRRRSNEHKQSGDDSRCVDLQDVAKVALAPAIAALTKPRPRRLQ